MLPRSGAFEGINLNMLLLGLCGEKVDEFRTWGKKSPLNIVGRMSWVIKLGAWETGMTREVWTVKSCDFRGEQDCTHWLGPVLWPFARNLSSLCIHPEDLSQAEFKGSRLICLAEKNLKTG